MGQGNIKELLEKYYTGETTLEEELALKKYFRESTAKPGEDKMLFQYLERARSERHSQELDKNSFKTSISRDPGATRRPVAGWWATGIAACLLLALGIFLPWIKSQQNNNTARTAITNEQATAMAEIRKAMLKVSVNLNKGQQNVAKLSKFSQATNLVTSKNTKK